MTGTAASPPCRRGRLDDRRGGISFGVHEFLDGRCGKIALGLRGRLEDRRGGAADVRLNLSKGFIEMDDTGAGRFLM